ncbi:hypothetical protein CDAR_266451 [Caerostris darwini]|uniref:Ycf1 n=1 Tax=Caerostris darwini TaxID=1538125 RepID=A0AAV4Q0D0_9ARAC|nr:hypothetical protein CDAR_266451 [Caerostris darwini]
MREISGQAVRENSPQLGFQENPKDMLCFQTKMVDLEGCNKSPKDLEEFAYQNEFKSKTFEKRRAKSSLIFRKVSKYNFMFTNNDLVR